MTFLSKCFVVIVLAFVFVDSMSATLLVVVRTKDGVWVGADGVRLTLPHGGGAPISTQVCKIHQTPFGVFMKAGNVTGNSSDGEYPINREVDTIVRASKSREEMEQKLAQAFENDLWTEIALKLGNRADTKEWMVVHTFPGPMPPQISKDEARLLVVITSEGAALRIRMLEEVPMSEPVAGGGFRYFIDKPEWRDLTTAIEAEDATHSSLMQFSMHVDYKKTDEAVQSDPYLALTEILKQGNDEHPLDIGPNYSIAFIPTDSNKAWEDQSRLVWKTKGNCPSWNFDLHQTGSTPAH